MTLVIQPINKFTSCSGRFAGRKSINKANIDKSNLNFAGINGTDLVPYAKNILGKTWRSYIKFSKYICYGTAIVDVALGVLIDSGAMKHCPMLHPIQKFMLDPMQKSILEPLQKVSPDALQPLLRLDTMTYVKGAIDSAQGYLFTIAGKGGPKAAIKKSVNKCSFNKVKAEPILEKTN